MKLRPSRQRARKQYLGADEQDVLFQLERLARGKPLLLVADDLQNWDAESLKLLTRFLSPTMGEAFPFLLEMHVIAVQTIEPYQSTANPRERDALIAASGPRQQLARPTRSIFNDVLIALDVPFDQACDEGETAFDLTGGHLALAARCAKRMREQGPGFLATVSDSDEFMRGLLSDRVRLLGSVGSGSLAVLQIAAVLGMRFRRAEVICAYGGEAPTVSKLLRDCRDEELIELSEEFGRFIHDLFRLHFRESGALDEASIHESISDCLRSLRPGDYVLRCRHARNAERERRAGIMGIHAALEWERDGLAWRDLPVDVLGAIDEAGRTATVERFVEALDQSKCGRIAACIEILNGLPRNARSLAAEADYIKAASLLSARSEDDRERAQAMLEAWP